MANLRIINTNLAKTATLTATTSAGSLVASNMQTDIKSQIWRSTANTGQTITATLTAQEFVNAVVLPFCSLTSQATMQIKLYTNAVDTTPVLDTGAVLCCENVAFDVFDWGNAPLGVNAYSISGDTYARVYFTTNLCAKIEVIINDSTNANAYIDIGCLVIGNYWQPEYNISYGATINPTDTSISTRVESGDNILTAGTKSRALNMNIEWLTPTNRDSSYNLLMQTKAPVFVSMYPEVTDSSLEQQGQIYGYCNDTRIGNAFYNTHNTSLTVEEL